jgi:hypothetical protein
MTPLLFGFTLNAVAQTPAQATPDAQHLTEIEHRLNAVTDALSQTQRSLEQSLIEIQKLRAQIDGLRAETGVPAAVPAPSVATISEDVQAVKEQQDIQQAEIQQHEQSKVETASKYRLRVTGVALFNAFSNAGVVDNVELPTIALGRPAGASHGSLGATLHQTLLGLEATGPVIAGARSSAAVNIDFFGGASTNTYGYTGLTGTLRMRQMQLDLDWKNTTAEVGYTSPLFSPLSPTSYATIAQPSFSGSGNLWTWSPQLRVEQRVPVSGQHGFSFEGGLIDPQSTYYTAIQADSPVEASRRPGVEGRVAYHADNTPGATTHSVVIGAGVYTADQFYNANTRIHSWAATGDWQIPLGARLELSGEVYRGRALGGFGGGAYKDVLVGTNPATGLPLTVGVDAAGGWSQLKFHLTRTLDANTAFGLDNALSSSFDSVTLASTINPTLLTARNNSVIGNLIFRPRASLIFSPEYRHLETWRYTGAPNVANIFTLSMGYQF